MLGRGPCASLTLLNNTLVFQNCFISLYSHQQCMLVLIVVCVFQPLAYPDFKKFCQADTTMGFSLHFPDD